MEVGKVCDGMMKGCGGGQIRPRMGWIARQTSILSYPPSRSDLLTQGCSVCTSNFAGASLSSPIVAAVP